MRKRAAMKKPEPPRVFRVIKPVQSVDDEPAAPRSGVFKRPVQRAQSGGPGADTPERWPGAVMRPAHVIREHCPECVYCARLYFGPRADGVYLPGEWICRGDCPTGARERRLRPQMSDPSYCAVGVVYGGEFYRVE
jgi:hypothetical protein